MPYPFCLACGACKPEVHTCVTCVGAAVNALQREEEKAGTDIPATATDAATPELAVGTPPELEAIAVAQVGIADGVETCCRC